MVDIKFTVFNDFAAVGFDAVGQEAVNLAAFYALYSGDTLDNSLFYLAVLNVQADNVNNAIDWLKQIQQQAATDNKVLWLALSVDAQYCANNTERMALLRLFMPLAHTVIVVPPITNYTQAQALATVPNFFSGLSFAQINFEWRDIYKNYTSNLAFFAYIPKCLSDDDIKIATGLEQQWQSSYVPFAFVQGVAYGLRGNLEMDEIFHMMVGGVLVGAKSPMALDVNCDLNSYLFFDNRCADNEIDVSVLLMGLDIE